MTQTAPKVKTKVKKGNGAKGPTSPKEIKSWLRGVLEFQPDDWVPGKEQWDAICDKIFSLEETESHNVTNVIHNQHTGYVDQSAGEGYETYAPVPIQGPIPQQRSVLASPQAMAAAVVVDDGHISPPAFAQSGDGIVAIKGQDGINSSFR